MLMSLMGYIRSGLREDWHIFGVVRDLSESAFTPTMAEMSRMVSGIVVVFLILIALVFWLAGLAESEGDERIPSLTNVRPAASAASGQD